MSLVDIQNDSDLLNSLYRIYNLDRFTENADVGRLTNQLGDVYEKYILEIFENKEVASSWQQDTHEKEIVDALLAHLELTFDDILELEASDQNIPPTGRGGTPKTDVYLTISLMTEGIRLVPMSIKQSTVPKVAVAEYSVEDIVSVLGIGNQETTLIELLEKHQTDASATNFTDEEIVQLRVLLAPYAQRLVRWCLTLNPNPTAQHISHPEYFIKFNLYPKDTLNRSYCLKSVKVYDIDEYVHSTMHYKNGRLKEGGFGTGLGWTYASGSKGRKIQFKA